MTTIRRLGWTRFNRESFSWNNGWHNLSAHNTFKYQVSPYFMESELKLKANFLPKIILIYAKIHSKRQNSRSRIGAPQNWRRKDYHWGFGIAKAAFCYEFFHLYRRENIQIGIVRHAGICRDFEFLITWNNLKSTQFYQDSELSSPISRNDSPWFVNFTLHFSTRRAH